MLTERLQAAVNHVAELPEASQAEFAALEQLLSAYAPSGINGSNDPGRQRPPELRPELAAIVDQAILRPCRYAGVLEG